MLADAGVELGVTYPYPVISLEESEEHLQIAAKVIQETLAASLAASQVRLLLAEQIRGSHTGGRAAIICNLCHMYEAMETLHACPANLHASSHHCK